VVQVWVLILQETAQQLAVPGDGDCVMAMAMPVLRNGDGADGVEGRIQMDTGEFQRKRKEFWEMIGRPLMTRKEAMLLREV